MTRFYAILALAAFLFVGYWFIAHSFVIVRLTSVLGLWAAFAAVFFVIYLVKRYL